MSENESGSSRKEKFAVWYDKNYKRLLILPAGLLLIAMVYLGIFFTQHGDIVLKDVSLTGGTSVTVIDPNFEPSDVKAALREQFPDIIVRGISDIRTGRTEAFFVETTAPPDEIVPALEAFLGYELTSENSSIEFTGESLSRGFYQQLRIAVLAAFLFMAGVVFYLFRSPIPSLAVILSAFADIVLTIAVLDIFGISLSIGGIAALLMLIGYSVDTDILLTTRILRLREDSLNERMFGALKTGMMMTITSLVAIGAAYIVIFNFSETLGQIFMILLIGLGFDIFNTWIMNASILKWYAVKKGIT